MDAEATAFLEAYCPEAIKAPTCIPIESIAADKMKLTVLEYHLSEDLSILGQMCFTDGRAEIYDPDKEEYREIVVKAGTMIIDPDTYAKRNLGSKRNTMAHECFHWHRHRKYHQMAAKIVDSSKTAYRCPTVFKDEKLKAEWTDEDWIEHVRVSNIRKQTILFIARPSLQSNYMQSRCKKKYSISRIQSPWIKRSE